MEFTQVEVLNTNKSNKISIKPYFDNSMSNMGLEHYGQSLFDGVKHFEQLACLEQNGVDRCHKGSVPVCFSKTISNPIHGLWEIHCGLILMRHECKFTCLLCCPNPRIAS